MSDFKSVNDAGGTNIRCILIPLAVGALAAILSSDSMETFERLNRPALTPPAAVFPIVWTILYVLMGIASYFVYEAGRTGSPSGTALTIYGIQLILNFCWTILFFNFGLYLGAFVLLVVLWLMILTTMVLFMRIKKIIEINFLE